jgi:hypothetical protein
MGDLEHFPDTAEHRLQRRRYSVCGRCHYSSGIIFTPALGAAFMSLSTVIVVINARLLRLKNDGCLRRYYLSLHRIFCRIKASKVIDLKSTKSGNLPGRIGRGLAVDDSWKKGWA